MLTEKVILITGGGSGVGRAAALACARERARVAVLDLDAAGSEETIGLVHAAGGKAAFMQTDVTRSDRMKADFPPLECRLHWRNSSDQDSTNRPQQ